MYTIKVVESENTPANGSLLKGRTRVRWGEGGRLGGRKMRVSVDKLWVG